MAKGAPSGSPLPLTAQQHRFMLVLQHRLEADPDRGVSYEELREALGLRSKSGVSRLVAECVERGRLARIPRSPRSLRVLAPVVDVDDGPDAMVPAISLYTDAEILAEASRRGLLRA